MAMFGPYEEMTVYRPGTRIPDKKAMLERTREHLSLGTPVICEAAFSHYNNYCAVDILRKTETGYDFYEVKNAPEVRDQFVRDAAFQYYIITRSGLKISRIFIVTHGPDEENPFLPVEITKQAKDLYSWVNDHIWNLNRIGKQAEEVNVEPGPQCTEPYECWYYNYCHPLSRTGLASFLFIYLSALDLHCCAQAFYSYTEQRLLSRFSAQASLGGFSCCGAQALGTPAQ